LLERARLCRSGHVSSRARAVLIGFLVISQARRPIVKRAAMSRSPADAAIFGRKAGRSKGLLA